MRNRITHDELHKFKAIFGDRSLHPNIVSKTTMLLIFILIVAYIVQIIYINPNEALSQTLKTHTNHLFEGNYWSILTSIFLHADLIHLITNLVALLIFGRIVEKHLGFKLFFVFLGSGVIANVISNTIAYFLGVSYFSLGASGAIAGIIMFALLLDPFAFTRILIIPIPAIIIGWILIFSDITGLTNSQSNVNYLAHLAGYASLLVLFFFLEFKHRKQIKMGLGVNLFILIILYLLSTIIDFQAINWRIF